jgi:hypothetical protein
LRLGDRRRALRALIEQDPTTALDMLADQAQRWATRHRTDQPLAGPIAAHWADRATATAGLLRIGARTHPSTGTGEEECR